MLSAAKHLSAHRNRPEARAQGDKTLPILVGKIHYRPVSPYTFSSSFISKDAGSCATISFADT
jgi:hypothetical protein